MNKFLIAGIAAVTLTVHYGIYLNWKIDYQDQMIKLADQKSKIDNDQIRDLLIMSQQTNYKIESARTEGYVSGAVDVIHKPDRYNAIWHAGYDRGVAVQIDADLANKNSQASQKINVKNSK